MLRTPALILATAAAALAVSVPAASALTISELRLLGPAGNGDEYVEIHNESAAPAKVQATDGSAGYAVAGADGQVRFVIPNGTVIPAGGHYLATGPDYSGHGYAGGDLPYATGGAHDDGVALFRTASPAGFTLANRIDAFGFAGDPALYREGTGMPSPSFVRVDGAYVRDLRGGTPRDTDDNRADFRVPNTHGASLFPNNGEFHTFGAPGPEDLASPVTGQGGLQIGLFDPDTSAAANPNVVRDYTSDESNNSQYGTLSLRRTIKNTGTTALTRLRLRVADITTFPAPGGTADLRARTSGQIAVGTPAGVRTVHGATLEQPPSQPNGGALNSSLTIPAVSAADPLSPGESIHVHLVFGLEEKGTYRVCLLPATLPAASGALLAAAGNTETANPGATACSAPALKPAPVVEEPGGKDDDGNGIDPGPARDNRGPGGGGGGGVVPGGRPVDPQRPPQDGGVARDAKAPRVTALKLARTRRAGSFKVDEAAKVTIRVERAKTKKRVGRAVTVQAKAGANRFKLKGKRLAAGRYRLVAVAVDAAGNKSAKRTAFAVRR